MFSVFVLEKPVVVYVAFLLRNAANHNGCLGSPERVIVDFDRRSGDIRAVFSIAPAVHVETVAQRYAELNVVPGDIAAAGPARARDRVPVPVE